MKSSHVILFGEALIDRLGPIGGDLSFNQSQTDCFGGAPANVACALSRLGVNVSFIGSLGNDSFGHNFKNLMINRGINLVALQEDKFRPTRVVLVNRDSDGERSFGGFEGDMGLGFADQAISLDKLTNDWQLISQDAKWLIIGTIPLASKESSEAFSWCIKKSLDSGINIALDLNWRPTFWRNQISNNLGPSIKELNIIKPYLNCVSLIKLAKEEAQWFFKSSNATEISLSLPQRPSVIITDGSNPVNWKINQNIGITNSIVPPSVVDTTGAGDAFTAGLIYKLLSYNINQIDKELAEEIIKFAICCGAYVCQGVGAINSQPNQEDIDKLLCISNGGIS